MFSFSNYSVIFHKLSKRIISLSITPVKFHGRIIWIVIIYIKMNVTNKRGATMPHSTRPNSEKYEKILEALRTLLETKKISQISVSESPRQPG